MKENKRRRKISVKSTEASFFESTSHLEIVIVALTAVAEAVEAGKKIQKENKTRQRKKSKRKVEEISVTLFVGTHVFGVSLSYFSFTTSFFLL